MSRTFYSPRDVNGDPEIREHGLPISSRYDTIGSASLRAIQRTGGERARPPRKLPDINLPYNPFSIRHEKCGKKLGIAANRARWDEGKLAHLLFDDVRVRARTYDLPASRGDDKKKRLTKLRRVWSTGPPGCIMHACASRTPMKFACIPLCSRYEFMWRASMVRNRLRKEVRGWIRGKRLANRRMIQHDQTWSRVFA